MITGLDRDLEYLAGVLDINVSAKRVSISASTDRKDIDKILIRAGKDIASARKFLKSGSDETAAEILGEVYDQFKELAKYDFFDLV